MTQLDLGAVLGVVLGHGCLLGNSFGAVRELLVSAVGSLGVVLGVVQLLLGMCSGGKCFGTKNMENECN